MEDEVDVGAEDSQLGSEEPQEETGKEEQPEPEPFLKVNDRTTYADREAALKGYQEKDDYIARYSRHGKPEEIEAKLAELKVLNDMGLRPGEKASEPDEDDPLGDIKDPKLRAEYEALMKRVDRSVERKLKKGGYLTNDALREQLPGYFRSYNEDDAAFRSTREAAQAEFKAMGLTVNDQMLQALESQVIEIGKNKQHPLSQEVNQLWNDGDYKGLATVAIKAFGLNVERPKPAANPEDAQRLEHAATKEATKRLPKPPPRGRSSSAEAEDPEKRRERMKTHDGRKELALEIERRHRAG